MDVDHDQIREIGMMRMFDFLLNDVAQLVLICVGIYLVAKSMGDTFFPKRQGTVVAIDPHPGCSTGRGASTIQIVVKLGNGSTERAEISACTACIEKIKEGDTVSLSHIGRRMIAQKGVLWCR
jgi:hypothetical protein